MQNIVGEQSTAHNSVTGLIVPATVPQLEETKHRSRFNSDKGSRRKDH